MTLNPKKVTDTKCYVCKLRPCANFWKYFVVDGRLVPVCSKRCAVDGSFAPRPVYRARMIRELSDAERARRASRSEGLAGAI